ncbi:MAG TPA: hypothetical protein PKE32_08680, partial [Miltoncostaeaceae bacterium]|nr:hypothetical protein [Miltoncostaeaceae bacterium]
MSRRGVVILSVLFGLFVVSFGVLGLRALALGPDANVEGEIVRREAALARSQQAIAAVRDEQLPPLPEVPGAQATDSAAPWLMSIVRRTRVGDDDHDDRRAGEREHGDDDHDRADHHSAESDHDRSDHHDDDHHDDGHDRS